MSDQEPYCRDIILKICEHYQNYVFVYITIPICLVGMILNLFNVLIFTRKPMNSPPNLILAHLAFVDFIVLLTRIVGFCMEFIQPKYGFYYKESYTSTQLYWYGDILGCSSQFISAFLTVQLAAWRYIAVVHPLKERYWCTKKITRNVMIIEYVICCVSYAIPYYLSLGFAAWNTNGKIYYKATVRHPIMDSIQSIVFGLLAKILPSFVLAGLTSRIVVALLARKTHRDHLSPSASTQSGMRNDETRLQTNRSTAILLAVAALFFIAEFPKGILWLLMTINKNDWETCYDSLLGILLTITDINISITFVVYYTLSHQFRTTFKSLFNLNKRTTSHQTHTPLALGDTEETQSGRKTSQV